MSLVKESLDFVEQLVTFYLYQRDMSAVLGQLSSNCSWIGTGTHEFCHSREEAHLALSRELEEYQGSISAEAPCFFAEPLGDSHCMVYGSLSAQPQDEGLAKMHLRLTLICEKTSEGMRLLHCHASQPDYLQDEGHYYVRQQVRADTNSLRNALADRDQKLESLTRNIPGGVRQCLCDPEMTLLHMSDSFLTMFGYSTEEIFTQFGNKYINMIYPPDRVKLLQSMQRQLMHGTILDLEYRVQRKDGSLVWVLDRGARVREHGGDESFYCVLLDITQRKNTEEDLRLSLERHQLIMDQATDIIFEWNIIADTMTYSPNWRKKFGYAPISQEISTQIPKSSNIHSQDRSAFMKIMRDTAAGVPYSETEFRIRDKSGQYCWCRIRATTQFDHDNKPIKAVGVISDITTEHVERTRLMELAQQDPLTGLYNKAAIRTLVEQRMGSYTSRRKQAMLIIDVDNFKTINDTYSHLQGDAVLADIAKVLKNSFRATDFVGRIGGDEFLVYLPAIPDEEATREKVEALLSSLKTVHPAPSAPPIQCSVGVVVCSHENVDYLSMYQWADGALYQQKRSGKGGITFYDPQKSALTPEEAWIHSAVGEIITNGSTSEINGKLIQYIFRMLCITSNVSTAIDHILATVGQAYEVSRVYIFESSQDGSQCSNTFEWCADGILPQKHRLQNLSYEDDLQNYQQFFDSQGLLYCSHVENLPRPLQDILRPQKVEALLQCAITSSGAFWGFVGFDECNENRLWSQDQIHSLSLIANVLAVFLTKLRLEERISELTPPTTDGPRQ